MLNNAQLLASYGLEARRIMFDGAELTDLEVVRHVPNRRCVCKGVWKEKGVYVKFFLGGNFQRYALRDVTGISYLQAANIKTPSILSHGLVSALSFECYAIVFEAISSAKNAEEMLPTLSGAESFSFAQKLVQTVAKHHQAGLVQTDMYFKNFLVSSDGIITLDGDGVRQPRVLSKPLALANLSELLSKFDVLLLESWLPTLLKIYAEERLWGVAPDLTKMKRRIGAARRKAASAYADKKVFRQCADVNVVSTPDTFIAFASAYLNLALPKTLSALDEYFKQETIIKDGNTCTVAVANLGERKVVIKRYNIKSFWHGVSRALRKTRAAFSWGNAHRLKLLEIATASPIALIETRKLGLKGKAYFLAEYIDAPDIDAFFKHTSDKAQRAEVIKQMGQLFYRLYLLDISHGDMKASNIKVLGTKPLLIDLDSMQQHKSRFIARKAHVRDLRRFMQNWKDDTSLYNGFIKAFKVIYANHAPLLAANILE